MKWNSATATALYNASKESNPEAIPAGEYFAKITASEAYTFENPEDETKPDKYGALIEVTITRGQQKGKKLYKFICFDWKKRDEYYKSSEFLRGLYVACCVDEPDYISPEKLLGLSGYILKYRRTPQDFRFSTFNGHYQQMQKLNARIERELAERKAKLKGN